ncbi:hypothetical protein QFC19_001451 [Naganishia cerealis]|uniref:Uncharacterized protein n=1 Tax=Naganishia cerealis TaxID=610337 RepID=A0ACC2WHT9_9TREE|nr:hypothetical protein QFC19_001451 [Naganishia cerealis]
MNTHHVNPHTVRRKRHLFDPSRLKIGIEGSKEVRNVPDGGRGGTVRVKAEDMSGLLAKRQWHEPWSMATTPPAYLTSKAASSAAVRSTVVVTRVKGTTVVTGTPPASSTSIAKASSTSSSVAKPATTSAPATTPSSTAQRTTSSEPSPSPSTTSTPSPTPSSTTTPTTLSSSSTSLSSQYSTSSTLSTIAAVTLSSLPASVHIATALTLGGLSSSSTSTSTSSSTTSTASASETAGAMNATSDGTSEGLSTSGKVGIAVGVVGGLGVLGFILFLAYVSSSLSESPLSILALTHISLFLSLQQKRFSRDRNAAGPFDEPSYTNGGALTHHHGGYTDYDDDWHAPAATGYGRDNEYANQESDYDQSVFATRQGGLDARQPSGMSSIQAHNQMMMAHPYAATSYATYSAAGAAAGPGSARTRDLTNIGPYASYDDGATGARYTGYGYQDTGGRDSPTDYYGHAMSSANTDMMIATQYADMSPSDDGHFGQHGMGAAIASPYAGGMAITNGEPVTAQRVPINNNGSGGHGIPASHSFDSGLYADDAQQQQRGQSGDAGAKVLSRKSSQAQPRTGQGNDQLRQEYREVARAAQVEEPMTPNTAALAAAGGFGHGLGDSTNSKASSRRSIPAYATSLAAGTPLTPMPAPERYQHGQPLTSLPEIETPDLTPASRMLPASTFPDGEVNPFTDLPGFAHLPPARSSDDSLALPLPRPNYSHIDTRYDALSLNSSNDSSVLPSHYGIPMGSMHMPPPSPGVSLPESPASYVDPGRHRFAGPSVASAVSLHVPSPEGSSGAGYRVSASEFGWSPASGQVLAVAANSASPLNNGNVAAASQTQQGQPRRPCSTVTDSDDAYDGI